MNAKKKVIDFINKYKHAWVFAYFALYMPWFLYLENNVPSSYHIIHSVIDDKIPFIEYFIIPYLLWFVFIAAVFIYFFFTDVQGFYKLSLLLFSGMTIFLLVSTFFPNGLALRPTSFARDNIFVDMVKILYATDTSTNVFPSIHVFNSLGVSIAIAHSDALKKHNLVRYTSYFLAATIILATMFLKQHSIIDVVFAFIMAYGLCQFVYVPETKKETVLSKQVSW